MTKVAGEMSAGAGQSEDQPNPKSQSLSVVNSHSVADLWLDESEAADPKIGNFSVFVGKDSDTLVMVRLDVSTWAVPRVFKISREQQVDWNSAKSASIFLNGALFGHDDTSLFSPLRLFYTFLNFLFPLMGRVSSERASRPGQASCGATLLSGDCSRASLSCSSPVSCELSQEVSRELSQVEQSSFVQKRGRGRPHKSKILVIPSSTDSVVDKASNLGPLSTPSSLTLGQRDVFCLRPENYETKQGQRRRGKLGNCWVFNLKDRIAKRRVV